ncbi:hypothetical protein AAHB49_23225 [Bacillus cereus]
MQEDENPSETRENIEGTDSSEGSREETVKKSLSREVRQKKNRDSI